MIFPLSFFPPSACASLHQRVFQGRGWTEKGFQDLLNLETVWGEGLYSSESGLFGFYMVQYVHEEAEILTLLVHPDRRTKGWGAFLLESLLRKAHAQKMKKIFLEVSENNDSALSLYRRFGFQLTGYRPVYYRQKNHPNQNALVLVLLLS